jgi:hypothetical protein
VHASKVRACHAMITMSAALRAVEKLTLSAQRTG